MPGYISLRASPLETDGEGTQLGTSYQIPLWQRLFLNGFSEYNIQPGGSNRWMNESQINLRVLEPLSLVVEFRHNGFLSGVPNKDSVGWAPGIRVDFQF